MFIAAIAGLAGRAAGDDKMEVSFPASNSSTGSTNTVVGCPLGSSTASSGTKVLVRFQAVRVDDVEYSRVLVPSERMTMMDVELMELSAPTFAGCVNAAANKELDIFSFVDGACLGFTVAEGICPCTTGDFVLYRTANAIRSTSSSRASTVSMKRADSTPLPAGFVRKIIYPSVSMTGDRFERSSSRCEDIAADTSISPTPSLLHTVDGKCYYTHTYQGGDCDSCGGPATEVIIKSDLGSPTFFLSQCGETITAEEFTEDTGLNVISHEGYGCIPYPDLSTDDDCVITFQAPSMEDKLGYSYSSDFVDIDESNGSSCDGDELYFYDGPENSEDPCKNVAENGDSGGLAMSGTLTIKFERTPAYMPDSRNEGFAIIVAHISNQT